MQTTLVGFGSGGRILTRSNGTPRSCAAAASSFGRYSAKRSMTPRMTSWGPRCGMSCTTRETSTTESPVSTPSLNSSKNTIFMVASLWSEFQERTEGLEHRLGIVLVQGVYGARDLDQRAARQLARHALGHVAVEHHALGAAQQQQRRLDLAHDRPPVHVAHHAALLDGRMPLPDQPAVGAGTQARRRGPAIVMGAGGGVAAVEGARRLLHRFPRLGVRPSRRPAARLLADLGADVEDGDPLHQLGPLRREVHRAAPTHRQADQRERAQAELLDDAREVAERPGRVADVGGATVPRAGPATAP